MPLLDISKVSETLKTLIKTHVEASSAWPLGTPVEVSLDPPDKLNGESNGQADTIGLYLYHLAEDAYYKNLPAPGRDQPPIRYTPMGLNLYYQLSAHSTGGVVNEQRMMGLTVKALRDYPVIDDSTRITDKDGTDVEILNIDLKDENNRFRIVLQPIAHNDAVAFWTASSTALRLAAYYQVSVVLLEPEETRSRTGRVLSYGVHSFVSGSPRVDHSTNVLFFRYPGEAEDRQVELRPAQVPFVVEPPPTDDKPKNGDFAFVGSGLTGAESQLVLKSRFWEGEALAGSGWRVAAAEDRVTAIVRGTVETKDGPTAVWPGMYAALVRVVTHRTLSDGSIREFQHSSNQMPFVISPRIDGIVETDPVDPAGIVTTNIWYLNGYEPAANPEDPAEKMDVQVYLGNTRLSRIPLGTPSASEFVVDNEQTLRFVRPLDLQAQSGRAFPLRIFVNGAESPPNWVATP